MIISREIGTIIQSRVSHRWGFSDHLNEQTTIEWWAVEQMSLPSGSIQAFTFGEEVMRELIW
jgi:hypothetical protein